MQRGVTHIGNASLLEFEAGAVPAVGLAGRWRMLSHRAGTTSQSGGRARTAGSSTPGGETGAAGGTSAGLLSGPEAALALGDVRNAFAYYLDHLSHGRKFVLMGHSLGSGMLIGLMQN